MMRTYQGGCHCGAVRFEADVDISAGTVKCNCSICIKMRQWVVKAAPTTFRLLKGEADLTDYTFGSGVAHHFFCRHCGLRAFERVDLPFPRGTYFNLSVTCLDGVDMDELMSAPMRYEDGWNDAWETEPSEIRHL